MQAEVEFVLEALDGVVQNQPSDHPLRRVDRDRSRRYDGGGQLSMTAPIQSRKSDLQIANLVGVRSESRDNTPYGTDYDVETDVVLSIRVEGLDYREGGNIDPAGTGGVVFDALCADIRTALYNRRTYPQVTGSGAAELDLRITSETALSSDHRDYYRRDLDVTLRGREALP
jgi:hypothetical protein